VKLLSGWAVSNSKLFNGFAQKRCGDCRGRPITARLAIAQSVVLSEKDGLPEACAANFDNLPTMPKRNIERANSCADTARAPTRHAAMPGPKAAAATRRY
jgi:hypothetical protein